MAPRRAVLFLVALAGCARGVSNTQDDGADDSDATDGTDDSPMSDAPRADAEMHVDAAIDAELHIDAPPDIDAMIDGPPAMTGTSLLLTEVAVQPNEGEFIEIANPTNTAVALTGYYLTDYGDYWKLPAGVTAGNTDFIVKFPAGASIGAHAVITVALDTTANFQTTYASSPTYSIASGTMTTVTGSAATLTNTGEAIGLFFWDGQSDLVKDVDLFLVGAPTAANKFTTKSGITQDGPDAGATATAYATDANTLPSQTAAPGMSLSTKRIASESTHEAQAGTGNGITGDDETSENTAVTWDSTFTAPTPGAVPAAVMQ